MSKMTYGLSNGAYTLQSGMMGAGSALIDDFEDGDLAEWNIPSQTGTVTTSSSTQYNGTYSMNTQADGLTDAFAAEADLPAIPRPGDMWEFYVRFGTLNSSAQARFYFGRQSAGATDCYEIQMYNDGTFRIQKDIDNTNYGIGASTTGVSYQTGVWYQVRHWWQHADKSNDHVLQLTDMSSGSQLAQISANDTRFYAGNIGLRMNSNAGGFWDYMRVVERT